MAVFTPFLDKMSKLKDIRRTQIFLPIAKKECEVTPLLVGDDYALKTSIMSPAGTDREFTSLLRKHTYFIEDGKSVKYNMDQFCKFLCRYDRLTILWGVQNSTYDVLSENRKITCERKDCGSEFTETISFDDLVHEDTFTIWEEDIPFYDYNYLIQSNYDDYQVDFISTLPSISRYNSVLDTIDSGTLQRNLEKTGSIFTLSQQICMLTKALRISSRSGQFEPAESNNMNEIMMAVETSMPHVMSEELLEKHRNRFDRYEPKFYKEVKCPKCGYEFRLNIDLEIEFLRRYVFGRGESSEKS